jgi:hypothetical protein
MQTMSSKLIYLKSLAGGVGCLRPANTPMHRLPCTGYSIRRLGELFPALWSTKYWCIFLAVAYGKT